MLSRRLLLSLGVIYFALNVLMIFLAQLRRTEHTAIFGSFWEAGRHLDYAIHPMVWFALPGIAELNMNPPALLPLFQFFALFDPQVGQAVWLFVSVAIHLTCVWKLRKTASTFQLCWLLTAPIVLIPLSIGQIYVLLFAIGVLIFLALKSDRIVVAAILVGILVAMKPNFAVWGLVAFAAGHYRAAVTAGVVASALSLVPVLLYGSEIYEQWFHAVALDRHGVFPQDVSLRGYFWRLGIPGAPVAIAIVSLSTLVWAWRSRPSLYDLTPAAILAAMLCSPLAWLDYLLVVAAFFVAMPWPRPAQVLIAMTYASAFAIEAVQANLIALALASSACLAPVLGLWWLWGPGEAIRQAIPTMRKSITQGQCSEA